MKARVPDFSLLLVALTRALLVLTSSHLTKNKNYGAVELSTIQTLFSAGFFTIIAILHFNQVHYLTNSQWLIIAFLAAACTLFVQLWAIQRTSVSRASLLLGTEPIWAVAVVVLIGGKASLQILSIFKLSR